MAVPSQPRKTSIAGIGLIALDLLVQDDSEVVAATAGGTCGNVLAILSLLGWKSKAIGRLAADSCGQLVCEDLRAWGVDTTMLGLAPTAPTPAIVERLRVDSSGVPFHTFAFSCPWCGGRLPSYQPVTISSLDQVSKRILRNDVLFVDRASPGAVELASMFTAAGKIVVFEPSSSRVDHLFHKLLNTANVIKYSHDRFAEIEEDNWPCTRKLEIQTLGRGGLRFRMAQKRSVSSWQHLPAPRRETVVDACGAGDWATAGLIHLTCRTGLTGLENLSKERVLRALNFAQKLGSWDCGYAGARGPMYSMAKDVLLEELRKLADSQVLPMPTMEGPIHYPSATTGSCSLCSDRATALMMPSRSVVRRRQTP